jgi:hypothetical protein
MNLFVVAFVAIGGNMGDRGDLADLMPERGVAA